MVYAKEKSLPTKSTEGQVNGEMQTDGNDRMWIPVNSSTHIDNFITRECHPEIMDQCTFSCMSSSQTEYQPQMNRSNFDSGKQNWTY